MQSFKKHSGSKSQVEIKKGDIPVQLNDDFENHFEFGIEAALQDFGILKCKIVNIDNQVNNASKHSRQWVKLSPWRLFSTLVMGRCRQAFEMRFTAF